jgi:hypothetical protein
MKAGFVFVRVFRSSGEVFIFFPRVVSVKLKPVLEAVGR